MRVHIERLVLEGISISPDQRPLLQTAVEDELKRLLVADGISPTLTPGRYPSLAASIIQLTANSDPGQLGRHIARSVYEGIGQ